MANWGLLQGFGKGLSNGSALLSQAMAEDREAERQRMREESLEKRWKRQEAREDERAAKQDKRLDKQEQRQDRLDKASASESAAQQKYRKDTLALQRDELNARTDSARKERIENTLNSYLKESERKGDAIDRKYDRLIDVAKANGATDEIKSLYEARDAEHAALSKQTEAKLIPALKSFGPELQGTAFSNYYDEIIKSESAPQKQKQSADPAMVQGVLNDLGPTGSQNGRAGYLQQINTTKPIANPTTPAPAYSVDASGAPELSIGNLLKKWGQNMQPTPVTEQQNQFTQSLQQNNITSAYGAAAMAQRPGLLQYAQQQKK